MDTEALGWDNTFTCESCGGHKPLDEQHSASNWNETGIGAALCSSCCAFVDQLLTRESHASDRHPTQPHALDKHGVLRFKQNAIVRWLLDAGPFDLNIIAVTPFDVEDRRQFAQLIGYSVSGYEDLSYSTPIEDSP